MAYNHDKNDYYCDDYANQADWFNYSHFLHVFYA